MVGPPPKNEQNSTIPETSGKKENSTVPIDQKEETIEEPPKKVDDKQELSLKELLDMKKEKSGYTTSGKTAKELAHEGATTGFLIVLFVFGTVFASIACYFVICRYCKGQDDDEALRSRSIHQVVSQMDAQ